MLLVHPSAADRAIEELAHQHVDADQHGSKKDERAATWKGIFTDIMADAPWIPIFNERRVVAKSKRMGGPANIYVDPARVINYDAIFIKK